jgi:hypothetical protein
MPYIKKEEQQKVNSGKLDACGDLNFAINQLVSDYLKQHGFNYQACNDVIGSLECAKLEIYRRAVSPYEDSKIEENGDVEPYTWLVNNDC